jgi:mycothiol synthase
MALEHNIRRILRLFGGHSRPSPQSIPQLRMERKFSIDEQLVLPGLHPDYRLLRYTPNCEEQWVQLINASGEFGIWNRDTLWTEMLSCLLPDGGILAAAGDRLVACSGAGFREEYDPYALLLWTAVLPEHRGKGLGLAVTAEALAVCQRAGYPGMILHTQDCRIPAIKTYLKLGFVPVTEGEPSAKQLWDSVLMRVSSHTS